MESEVQVLDRVTVREGDEIVFLPQGVYNESDFINVSFTYFNRDPISTPEIQESEFASRNSLAFGGDYEVISTAELFNQIATDLSFTVFEDDQAEAPEYFEGVLITKTYDSFFNLIAEITIIQPYVIASVSDKPGKPTSFADFLFGSNKKDNLKGKDGDDSLFGEGGADTLKGGKGDDSLVGGNGKDRLGGGRGDDELWGDQKDDRLSGGRGSDYLNGGDGDDQLKGGRGQDIFAYEANGGRDVISDFKNGEDLIEMSAADFANTEIKKRGDSVVIKIDGAAGRLKLEDTKFSQIDEGDFLFT